jgi:hypothetical protein
VGGKVGVLIEVNCETDFVARNDAFKALRERPLPADRRGQPTVRGFPRSGAEADLAKEREIAAAQVAGKPPAAVQKIVEGKLEKYYSTVCLLDQPFVKVPEKTIKEILTEPDRQDRREYPDAPLRALPARRLNVPGLFSRGASLLRVKRLLLFPYERLPCPDRPRGLTHCCPNCGGRTLFVPGSLFKVNKQCSACGFVRAGERRGILPRIDVAELWQ